MNEEPRFHHYLQRALVRHTLVTNVAKQEDEAVEKLRMWDEGRKGGSD